MRSAGAFHITAAIGALMMSCTSAPAPKPVPQPIGLARMTADGATKLSETQNWTAAAREWQQAADRFTLLNDRANQALALHNLAHAQRHLGKLDSAHEILEQSAALNLQLDNLDAWWRDQIVLLQIERQQKNTDAMEARFKKLASAPVHGRTSGTEALFLNELGLWQQEHGQLDKALKSFNDAETIFARAKDQTGRAATLANRARLRESQKSYSDALKDWKDALALFEQFGDTRGIACALAGQGRTLCAARWNMAVGESLLRQAAENFRRLKLHDERVAALQKLAECLDTQKKKDEADAVRRSIQQQ
jgi:tetratricopeptide (TPR) repeat protein